MSNILNILKFLPVAVLAVILQGCAAVGAGIGAAVSASEADKLSAGIVEVGEVKMVNNKNTNLNAIKTAKVLTVISEEDMATAITSPSGVEVNVNTAVVNETKRFFGIPSWNGISPSTFRVKTYFNERSSWGLIRYAYLTERKTLSYLQSNGIRKLVNTHFVLEQSGNVVLEVHGLWAGGNNSDEIKGARELAREMAKEVLKKLNSQGAQRTAAEAKKE